MRSPPHGVAARVSERCVATQTDLRHALPYRFSILPAVTDNFPDPPLTLICLGCRTEGQGVYLRRDSGVKSTPLRYVLYILYSRFWPVSYKSDPRPILRVSDTADTIMREIR